MSTETATDDAQNSNPISNSTPKLQNPGNGEISTYRAPQTCDDIDNSYSTPCIGVTSSPGHGSGSTGLSCSAPVSPMHFSFCTMSSPTTLTSTSSSIEAEFTFSIQLAYYKNSMAVTLTMTFVDELSLKQLDPTDEALHAPIEATTTSSTFEHQHRN
ncbi:hypothetical protein VitviT2T_004192 [Vitis vinifera]|uniref:Uncharacterized protein n=1 Tax=Vitis vinifera TaxID=29760 RepID=A0ABY9BPH4_VITVI|nr:hypothetical protein VitviT2T_004192 [Vitis vinifera]